MIVSGLLSIATLRQVPFFRTWAADQVKVVADHANLVELDADEVLVAPKDRVHSLYVVVRGTLRVQRAHTSGSARPPTLIVSAGFCVDEALPLCDEPSGITATAVEPSLVLELKQIYVEVLLQRHEGGGRLFANALLQRLAAEDDGAPPRAPRRESGRYQIFGTLGASPTSAGAQLCPCAFYLARDLEEDGRLCILYYRAGAWHEVTALRPTAVPHLVETFGNVPEAVAVAWLAELCLELDYWHQRGILYSRIEALTPAAIQLADDGHVSLAAPSRVPRRDASALVSQPAHLFTAPEVRDGEPARPSADVYALGTLLAYLVGHLPGEGAARPISAPLASLLAWATAPLPVERPATLAEFALTVAKLPLMAHWEHARKRPTLPPLPLVAMTSRSGPGGDMARRHGAFVAAILLLCALLATVGFNWWEGARLNMQTATAPNHGSAVPPLIMPLHARLAPLHAQLARPLTARAQRSLAPAAYHRQRPTESPLTLRQAAQRLHILAARCTGPASAGVVLGTAQLLASGSSAAEALQVATALQRSAVEIERSCHDASSGRSGALAAGIHRLEQRRASTALRAEARQLSAQLRQPGLCPTSEAAAAASTAERVYQQGATSTGTGPVWGVTITRLTQQIASLSPCSGTPTGQAAGLKRLGRAVFFLVDVVRLSSALSADDAGRNQRRTTTVAMAALPVVAALVEPRSFVWPTLQQVAVSDGRYVVAPGDSLWSIATRHYQKGFAWVFLWAANKYRSVAPGQALTDPNLIRPGWRLLVPRRLP